MDVHFIKHIQHSTANIMVVKKKNGENDCSIDFCNLKKACPKDEFSLHHIEMLIDAGAGPQFFHY